MKTVRIAVTGLGGAGKTVFLTSLINHLLEGGEETLGKFKAEGLVLTGKSLPQPSGRSVLPYRENLQRLRQAPPSWPPSTEETTEFGLELFVHRRRTAKTQKLKLRLVDYPGERLLDLPLLDRKFRQWSAEVVREAELPPRKDLSAKWLGACRAIPSGGDPEDAVSAYRDYLHGCRERGLTYLQPYVLLQDQHASPGFSPLPEDVLGQVPEVAQRFSGRYTDYVRQVKSFFKRVCRCSRQVVLVDVLGILRSGVQCYNDTRRCLRTILDAYPYALSRRWYSPLRLTDRVRRRRIIRRVDFVATKADQANQATRAHLAFLLQDLVSQKRRQLEVTLPKGRWRKEERPHVRFCAAHRATEDAKKLFHGSEVSCLKGIRLDEPEGDVGAWSPGEVPPEWPDDDWDPEARRFNFPQFQPKRLPMRDGAVIEHINLDGVLFDILEDLLP